METKTILKYAAATIVMYSLCKTALRLYRKTTGSMSSSWRGGLPAVTELWTYPIKSCRGIRLQCLEILETGVKYDRMWAVADTATGKLLTQRCQPSMALIGCSIDEERRVLIVNAPGMATLEVSMDKDITGNEKMEPNQWTVSRVGHSEGREAAMWFAKYLNLPTAVLLRCTAPCKPHSHTMHYVVTVKEDRGMFQDFSSLHILSTESLTWLRQRLPATEKDAAEVVRWRPNIVVSNLPCPFDEDAWGTFTIGGVRMRTSKPCGRCSVPVVDPSTGKPSASYEPIVALRQERHAYYPHQADRSMEGRQQWPMLGTNVFHDCQGTVRVGDVVKVLERSAMKQDLKKYGCLAV